MYHIIIHHVIILWLCCNVCLSIVFWTNCIYLNAKIEDNTVIHTLLSPNSAPTDTSYALKDLFKRVRKLIKSNHKQVDILIVRHCTHS